MHIINRAADWDKENLITQYWSGVSIFPCKNSNWLSKENSTYNSRQRNQQLVTLLLLTGFAGLLAFSLAQGFSVVKLLHGFLAFAGIAISILLQGVELGVQNDLVKQVCGTVNKVGCAVVLKTRFAKSILSFTAADMSLIYFATQFLLIALYPPVFIVVNIMAITSLSVVGWSIYTQAKLVKQWCALCLGVAGVLLLQGNAAVYYFTANTNTITALSFTTFAALYVMLAALWWPVKSLLKTNHANTQKLAELKKWKMDASLFKTLWEKEQQVDTTFWENDLVIGNLQAPILITVACNPYCGPCAKAHKQLDEMLERHKNNICVQVRFLCNISDSTDKRTKAVKSILQNAIANPSQVAVMLTDWFEWMDYKKWVNKWSFGGSYVVKSQLEKHNQWVKDTHVQFTPTFYLNKHKIPARYRLEEISGMIPALKEILKENKNIVE